MAAAHRSVRRLARTVGAGILTALLNTGSVSAQDLEPRAYSPSPVGTTFLVVTATRSTGGVLTDPSIPLTDVEAQLELGGVGVGHSFALLGKSALVLGAVPVTWATVSGRGGGEPARGVAPRPGRSTREALDHPGWLQADDAGRIRARAATSDRRRQPHRRPADRPVPILPS